MDEQFATAARSERTVGARSADRNWVVVAILDGIHLVGTTNDCPVSMSR